MSELRKVLSSTAQAFREGSDGILATVVNVHGSVYRRAGARLLATENGLIEGGVSGGCLENDIIERIARVLRENKPQLVTYDTTSTAEDLIWGLGLGCSGLVEVLIEPLRSRSVERFLRFFLNEKKAVSSALVFRSNHPKFPLGRRSYAFAEDKKIVSADAELLAFHCEIAAETKNRVIKFADADGEAEFLFEPLAKTTRLILCGAGNDALPLAKAAQLLDWEVVLVDHRKAFADSERFPSVEQILNVRPENLSAELCVESRDAFVIMTHNYQIDRELLRFALASEAFYVGALGPRRRTEQILSELAKEENFHLSAAQKARLHAPVGLDIGSETPAEIAFSIIAEIQAELSGRNGGKLRSRSGTIH